MRPPVLLSDRLNLKNSMTMCSILAERIVYVQKFLSIWLCLLSCMTHAACLSFRHHTDMWGLATCMRMSLGLLVLSLQCA